MMREGQGGFHLHQAQPGFFTSTTNQGETNMVDLPQNISGWEYSCLIRADQLQYGRQQARKEPPGNNAMLDALTRAKTGNGGKNPAPRRR